MTEETNLHPDELLPFYVNDTLDPDQRTEIEAHLHCCRRCQDETAFLRTLQTGVRQSISDSGPGDMAWPRLQRAIRRENNKHRQSPRWMATALAASLLVILAQSALLFHSYPEPRGYTLSGNTPAGQVVQLRFAPGATEADIRRVLQAVDARLVDGPGALGIYRVRLGDGDARSLEQRLDWLRQQASVISHAARE